MAPHTNTNYSVTSPFRSRRFAIIRYATAPLLIAIVDMIYAQSHNLRDDTPMSLFYLAVLISTIAAGIAPGLAAIVLGFFSTWYMNLPPEFSIKFDSSVAEALVVYFFTAMAIYLIAIRLLLAEGRAVSLLDWLFDRD
jgi:K+-sensing histidine kinase KdpD